MRRPILQRGAVWGPAAQSGPPSTWKASRKSRTVVAAGNGWPSSVAKA